MKCLASTSSSRLRNRRRPAADLPLTFNLSVESNGLRTLGRLPTCRRVSLLLPDNPLQAAHLECQPDQRQGVRIGRRVRFLQKSEEPCECFVPPFSQADVKLSVLVVSHARLRRVSICFFNASSRPRAAASFFCKVAPTAAASG